MPGASTGQSTAARTPLEQTLMTTLTVPMTTEENNTVIDALFSLGRDLELDQPLQDELDNAELLDSNLQPNDGEQPPAAWEDNNKALSVLKLNTMYIHFVSQYDKK